MAFTPQSNPWKSFPLVGALIDNIQNYLGTLSAAFAGKIDKPATPSTNDALFYNGTSWTHGKVTNAMVDPSANIDKSKLNLAGQISDSDVSATASIARSKLNFGSGLVNADIAAAAAIAPSKIGGGYSPNKITTGPMSSGPPASPTDGDIWIATDVDGSGIGLRWQFQYNAGSSYPYKWEFIGGPPIPGYSGGSVSVAAVNTWTNLVASTITIPHTGDYMIQGGATISHPTAGATMYTGIYTGAVTNVATYTNMGFPASGGYSATQYVPYGWRYALAAGTAVGMSGQNNVTNGTWAQLAWTVLPIRLA